MPVLTLSMDKRGPIAHLTLRRPETQNAIDGALLGELSRACEAIEVDDDVCRRQTVRPPHLGDVSDQARDAGLRRSIDLPARERNHVRVISQGGQQRTTNEPARSRHQHGGALIPN